MSKNKKKLIVLYIFISTLIPTTTYAMQKIDQKEKEYSQIEKNYTNFKKSEKNIEERNEDIYPLIRIYSLIENYISNIKDKDLKETELNANQNEIKKIKKEYNSFIEKTKKKYLKNEKIYSSLKKLDREIKILIQKSKKVIKNNINYKTNSKPIIILKNLKESQNHNIFNIKEIDYLINKSNIKQNEIKKNDGDIYPLIRIYSLIKNYISNIKDNDLKETELNTNQNEIEEKFPQSENNSNSKFNNAQIVLNTSDISFLSENNSNSKVNNVYNAPYLEENNTFLKILESITNQKDEGEEANFDFVISEENIEEYIEKKKLNYLNNFIIAIKNNKKMNLLDNEINIAKKYLEIINNCKNYIEEEYPKSSNEEKINIFQKQIEDLIIKVIFHYNVAKKIYNEIYTGKKNLFKIDPNDQIKKEQYIKELIIIDMKIEENIIYPIKRTTYEKITSNIDFKYTFYEKIKNVILKSVETNLANFKDKILKLNTLNNDKKDENEIDFLNDELNIPKEYSKIIKEYEKYKKDKEEKYKNENFFSLIKEKFYEFDKFIKKSIAPYINTEEICNEIYYEKEKNISESVKSKEEEYEKEFEKIYNKIQYEEEFKAIEINIKNILKEALKIVTKKTSIYPFIENIKNNTKTNLLNDRINKLKTSLNAIDEYEEYKTNNIEKYANKICFNHIKNLFNIYDKSFEIIKNTILNYYTTTKEIYNEIYDEQKEYDKKLKIYKKTYNQTYPYKEEIISKYAKLNQVYYIDQLKLITKKIKEIIPNYKDNQYFLNSIYDNNFKNFSFENQKDLILEIINDCSISFKNMFSYSKKLYKHNHSLDDKLFFLEQFDLDLINMYEKYNEYSQKLYENKEYFDIIKIFFDELNDLIEIEKKKFIINYETAKMLYEKAYNTKFYISDFDNYFYNYDNKENQNLIDIDNKIKKQYKNRIEKIEETIKYLMPEYRKSKNNKFLENTINSEIEKDISTFYNNYIKKHKENISKLENNFNDIDKNPKESQTEKLKFKEKVLKGIEKYKKYKESVKDYYKNTEYFEKIKDLFDKYDKPPKKDSV